MPKIKLIAILLVPVLALAGCGDSDRDEAQTTIETTIVRVPAGGPLDYTTFTVTQSENDCITTKTGPEEAIGCIGKDSLLVNARDYLESETEATPTQVDCVVESLAAKPLAEIHKLTWSGIGEAVYVPCGLPS